MSKLCSSYCTLKTARKLLSEMWFIFINLGISCFLSLVSSRVTDDQYVLMPKLFHLDDYDDCMLHRQQALYCSIAYQLSPLEGKSSYVWKIIEVVSSDPFNYRHDLLRHGVCVPSSCPNITNRPASEDAGDLKESLEDCYNTRYAHLGLRGNITEMRCETIDSPYAVDGLDIFIAIIFLLYLCLVIVASFYEGTARYKSKEDYEKLVGGTFGKLMAALSLCRNWHRLKTVKETEDVEKLKAIQGIRFYNMMLVILCHTVMVTLAGPVSNTRYVETLRDKFATLFLNNGGYAVQTFFMVSSWLLTYHVFLVFDGNRSFTIKDMLLIFLQRYLRLTPALLVVLAFYSSWFRHVDRGPLWDELVGTAFRRCRNNWWTNILYINNYVNNKDMCMPHTWYLAVDTQLFICQLVILWVLLRNKKHISLILTMITCIFTALLFIIIYINDYDPVIWPYPELVYRFKVIETTEWHVILGSVYSNFAGSITGICYGYSFYRCRNKELFRNKTSKWIWWIISLGGPLGIIIVPGLWINHLEFKHNIWFSCLYIAFGRLIFSFSIGYVIFGMSHGCGWIAKRICEWPPSYVLGRLTYSSYLIHVSLVFSRGGIRRSPTYIADYNFVCEMFGDVGVAIVAATLLTLLVEMPTSELMKFAFPNKIDNAGQEEERGAKSKIK